MPKGRASNLKGSAFVPQGRVSLSAGLTFLPSGRGPCLHLQGYLIMKNTRLILRFFLNLYKRHRPNSPSVHSISRKRRPTRLSPRFLNLRKRRPTNIQHRVFLYPRYLCTVPLLERKPLPMRRNTNYSRSATGASRRVTKATHLHNYAYSCSSIYGHLLRVSTSITTSGVAFFCYM